MLFGRTAIVVVAIACSASAIPGQYGVRDAKGPFSLLGRATSDHTIPYTPIAACNGSFFMVSLAPSLPVRRHDNSRVQDLTMSPQGVEPGSHGCPLLSRSDGGPYNGPTLLNFPSKPDDHFSSLVVARRSQAYYIAQDGSMDTTGYGHGSAAVRAEHSRFNSSQSLTGLARPTAFLRRPNKAPSPLPAATTARSRSPPPRSAGTTLNTPCAPVPATSGTPARVAPQIQSALGRRPPKASTGSTRPCQASSSRPDRRARLGASVSR